MAKDATPAGNRRPHAVPRKNQAPHVSGQYQAAFRIPRCCGGRRAVQRRNGDQPAGMIVNAANSPDGGMDALAVVRTASAEEAKEVKSGGSRSTGRHLRSCLCPIPWRINPSLVPIVIHRPEMNSQSSLMCVACCHDNGWGEVKTSNWISATEWISAATSATLSATICCASFTVAS